jgi:tRNA uridine 5-carbamoylmethylation protein Kti12
VPKINHHLVEASAKLSYLKEKVQNLQKVKRSVMNNHQEKETQVSHGGSKKTLLSSMHLDNASIQKALRMERIEKESSMAGTFNDDERALKPIHGTQQFTRDVIY